MGSPSRRSERVAAKNARNRLQELAEYEHKSSDDDANPVTKQTAVNTEKYYVDASAESQDEDWKRGRTPKYRQRTPNTNWQETVRALIGMRPDMAPALMEILRESEPSKVADQARTAPHLITPNVDNLARATPPVSPTAFFDPNGIGPAEQPKMQPQGVPPGAPYGYFAPPTAYMSYGAGIIPPWQGQPPPNTSPMGSAMNYQPMWQPWQQPFVQQQIAANQQIAELTNQLNTVLSMQVSSARRQELKELKPLTGFESAGKLKDFFRRFEEITAGCNSAKKSSYLRGKCEDRALRIFEKLSKDSVSYDEVKNQMMRQISESSTDSVEAIHLLTQGLKRAYNESVREYSNRVARTVKTAFPTADDSSCEMLLCYYFRIGLNNNQLSTAMTSLQNLSFEETVSHAIRMDTELSAIRGGPVDHNTRRSEMQRPSNNDQFASRRLPEQPRSQPSRHEAPMGFRPPTAPNYGRQDGQHSVHQDHTFPQQNRPPFTEMRSSNGNNTRVNQIQQDEGKKKKSDEEKRSKLSGSVPTLQLEVKGLFVRGLLDTGASISVLSQGCYAAIAGEEGRPVHAADQGPCIASNGQPLKVIGVVDLPVQYKQTELPTARFTVVADIWGHDMIIGTDLLDQLGFGFFDRHNGCHHSLSSLHEIDHSPKNPQTPIRVLFTTRVQTKEPNVVEAHFDWKRDKKKMRGMPSSRSEAYAADKHRRSCFPLVRQLPRSPVVRRRLRPPESNRSRSPVKRRLDSPAADEVADQPCMAVRNVAVVETVAVPGRKVSNVIGMVRLVEQRPPQRGKPMQSSQGNFTKRATTARAPGKYGLRRDSFAMAAELRDMLEVPSKFKKKKTDERAKKQEGGQKA